MPLNVVAGAAASPAGAKGLLGVGGGEGASSAMPSVSWNTLVQDGRQSVKEHI